MNNKVHKLSIIGATGRMGQMLVHAAQEKKDFQLVGLLEEKGHDLIGTNANELFPSLTKNLVISDACLFTIIGKGKLGYIEAINKLQENK